jgi:hypothetical protein
LIWRPIADSLSESSINEILFIAIDHPIKTLSMSTKVFLYTAGTVITVGAGIFLS